MLEMNISIVFILLIIIIVSFVVCYGIMRFIDDKLTSLVVNIPQPEYVLPPIYLTIDKDAKLKKINNATSTITTNNHNESLLDDIIEEDNDTYVQSPNKNESFGNLPSKPLNYDYSKQMLISDKSTTNNVVDVNNEFYEKQDPNFNTLNKMPLIVVPDYVSPNMITDPAYYSNKTKLVDKKDSELIKLQKDYLNKINNKTTEAINDKQAKLKEQTMINGMYDGYNSHVDLKEDSYANVTALGKSMLTPYISYPQPS